MPRPTKQTVDYFPHYATDSKTKFILESNWGNDGYAVWFKLLEILCKTDGHAYYLNDPLDWDYFISLMKVTDDVARAIIDKLAEIGKIDSELWYQHKVIWCPTLMEHIKFVYDKRKVNMPAKPILETKTGVFAPKTYISATKTGVFGNDNPQSKVKKIKEKESTPSISPPTSKEEQKKPKEKTTPEKKVYGDEFHNVRLTDDEYGKLVERLGKDGAADYIERLDFWLAEGHHKKSHYVTILNWWRTDEKKKKAASEGSVKADEKTFEPSVF